MQLQDPIRTPAVELKGCLRAVATGRFSSFELVREPLSQVRRCGASRRPTRRPASPSLNRLPAKQREKSGWRDPCVRSRPVMRPRNG